MDYRDTYLIKVIIQNKQFRSESEYFAYFIQFAGLNHHFVQGLKAISIFPSLIKSKFIFVKYILTFISN